MKKKLGEWGIKNKIEVVPNFFSQSLRGPIDQPEAISYDSGNYLLYFGRLTEEKGLLTLIWAMKQLPGIQLRIVGEGPLKEKLRNLADIPDNIELVGHKSGDELAREIANARAVVAPSEWYENYPLSVLEAMGFGKPIIAANIGGLPEIVRDGVSGLLFQPGNANDLAEKIKLLWNDVELARIFGQSGQKQVREENRFDLYYRRIKEIYDKLK